MCMFKAAERTLCVAPWQAKERDAGLMQLEDTGEVNKSIFLPR